MDLGGYYANPGDNYAVETLGPDLIPFTVKDFESNNTRIKTKSLEYEIPLIYSRGYLMYRVRGIGRFLENPVVNYPLKNFYGPWSFGTIEKAHVSDWEHITITDAHEDNKNWQFQSSYAEDGKKKEVVSYFDGTLRNRQTVTKNNSDNNAIAGEVFYDNQGRPAIETLPVPLLVKDLQYFKGLNRNVADVVYTHKDFDWDTASDCSISTGLMSDAFGASKYYSSNNAFLQSFIKYIPDAFKYPFSQTEYTPDNTGRIRRKGGVGLSHQLGTGHEMRYYYETAHQEELNRLFGSDVGYEAHYKKNSVIDPNGQVSISYIDAHGRTIATALTGGAAPGLVPLCDEANESLHDFLTIDLLNNHHPQHLDTFSDNNIPGSTGVFSNFNDKLSFSANFDVTSNNSPNEFAYSVANAETFSPDRCDEEYGFVYNLKISLKDECGEDEFTPVDEQIGVEGYGSSAAAITPDPTFKSLNLNTGSHAIVKELTVDEAVLNRYADHYVSIITATSSGEGCYVAPTLFTPTAILANCDVTCTQCMDQLGEKMPFVVAELKSYYNNDTFAATGETITFTDTNVDFNGTEAIDPAEIPGLVAQYKSEWLQLKDSCDRLCQPTFTSACSVDERTLLADISPTGQYGMDLVQTNTDDDNPIFDVTDILSVYNTSNSLFSAGTVTNHNWRFPSPPYKDDLGADAHIVVTKVSAIGAPDQYLPEVAAGASPQLIDVEENKYSILPNELKNVSDFLTVYWNPRWAESLLLYHPEYCYLEYSRKLCTLTLPVEVYDSPTATTHQTRELTSDEYSDYIQGLNTYAGAVRAELADLSGIIVDKIVDFDPYFSHPDGLGTDFESTTLKAYRKNIVDEAINTEYEDHGDTMLEEAYKITFCNDITTCAPPAFSSLTTEQKDALWNTYKNLYLSLKTKIKYVFINIYAKQHGCYNGCIGDAEQETVTSVISKYSDAHSLYNIFKSSSNPAGLCDHATAPNYDTKTKRFIPADFGYDSDISAQDALDELSAQTDYEIYSQTGSCPLLFDLNSFLSGFLGSPVAGLNNADTPIAQYLTLDLFNSLTSSATTPSSLSGSSVMIHTSVGGSGNRTLDFTVNTFPSTPIPLSMTIPSGATGLTWLNYGTDWYISEFKQMYYDAANSAVSNPSALRYAYQVIAVVVYGPETKEVIMSGETNAAIGECGIVNNGVGQLLDNNAATSDEAAGCSRRHQFKLALIPLLNALKQNGGLFSTTGVSLNIPAYTNSFLKDFLEDATPATSSWKYSSGVFSIVKGSNTLFTMTASLPAISATDSYEGIFIDNAPMNAFKLYYTGTDGVNYHIDGTFNETINFTCCATQTDIVPKFALRKQISGSTLEYWDRVFTPLNFSVSQGTPVDIEFHVQKNGPGLPVYASAYEATISFNGVPCNFSFESYNSFVNELNFYEPMGRLSWALYHGARFDIENLIYAFSSPVSASIATRIFNFAEQNATSTDDVSMELNPSTTAPPVWNGDKLSLGYSRETEWLNPNMPFSFDNDTDYPFKAYFKAKLTFTGDLPYYNSLNGPDAYYYGSIAQVDYVDPTNPTVMYSLLVYGENQNAQYCTTCVPQTVAPVDVQAKYDLYVGVLSTQGLPSTLAYSFEEFSANNLGYLVDSYKYYLEQLDIHSTEHPHYLSLIQFGDTNLNYGYNLITSVIDDYTTYLSIAAPQPPSDPDVDDEPLSYKDWRDYVNNYYMSVHSICPPAPMAPAPVIPVSSAPPCEEMEELITQTYQDDSYDAYIRKLRQDFITDYLTAAMQNVAEQFTRKYYDKEYQYTLYYYDQAGNLIKTVAPEGVVRLPMTDNVQIDVDRDANVQTVVTAHAFKTQYQYNSLNQLVWQNTPDGGVSKFAYDRLGRIIASQNARQIAADNRMSYSLYDALGRITEAGEIEYVPGKYQISDEGRLIKDAGADPVDIFDAFTAKHQVTRSVYDRPVVIVPSTLSSSQLFISESAGYAFNSRNRVTGVLYNDNLTDATQFDNAIFYNYDIHGNVKELVNYYTYLKDTACGTGNSPACEQHIKRVLYDYDLISGNVKMVTFQPSRANEALRKDLFIHKYEYDADNRIVNVRTSRDGVLWEKDADYKYYPHGPLARMVIGDKNVQGLDYAYTLQGWLKAVNGEDLRSADSDMGKDGIANTVNKDAFGYSLNYYDPVYNSSSAMLTNADYKAIGSADDGSSAYSPLMHSRDASIQPADNLFNGNIKKMVTAMRMDNDQLLPTQVNSYAYDQLNRLKSMSSSAVTGVGTPAESYSSAYSYDRNGNLKTMDRKVWNRDNIGDGSPILMDSLKYDYKTGNNQLKLVKDRQLAAMPSGFHDLKDQVSALYSELGITYNASDAATGTHNYVYNEIGQLVTDRTEGLTINWRVDGKVANITNSKSDRLIAFQYDGLGNRIAKIVSATTQEPPVEQYRTYYARDAQGNVLGVYKINPSDGGFQTVRLEESDIYGSSRLGLEERDDLVYTSETVSGRKGKSKNDKTVAKKSATKTIGSDSARAGVTSLPAVDPAGLTKYSLHLDATTSGTWNEPENNTINEEFNDFEVDSKFKTAMTTDSEIEIGKIEYSDKKSETISSPVSTRVDDLVKLSTADNISIGLVGSGITGTTYGPLLYRTSSGTTALARTADDYSIDGDGSGYVQLFPHLTISGSPIFGLSYPDQTGITYKAVGVPAVVGGLNVINVTGYYLGTAINTTPVALNGSSDLIRIRRDKASHKIKFYKVSGVTESLICEYSEPSGRYSDKLNVIFDLTNVQKILNPMVQNTVITEEFPTVIATMGTAYNQVTSPSSYITASAGVFSSTNASGAGVSTIPVLLHDGYVERELVYTGTSNSLVMATSLGLTNSSGGAYLYRDNISGTSYTFTTAAGTITGDFFNIGDKLRVERKDGILMFKRMLSSGGVLLYRKIALTGTQITEPLYLRMTAASGKKIYNVRVVNYVTPKSQITTMQLKVARAGGNYTPKLVVSKENWRLTDKYHQDIATYTGPAVTQATMDDIGMEVIVVKGNGTSPQFTVNGTTATGTTLTATTADNTTVSTGNSNIGPGLFDMCYFHYAFGVSPNIIERKFDFNSTSTATPIMSTTGSIAMAVTPSVVKILGPCLFDTDHDGIYDIYEIPADATDLANNDTDGDGTPNYLDADDDGDGVLTMYEGVDADGDHTLATGTQLNTDADALPDYLDPDDDNDGYMTFEEIVNDGDGNPNLPSAAPDTDGDAIPDYLDPSEQAVAQETEMILADYYNTAGDKRYELSNHLGNVLVVVNDKKLPGAASGTIPYYNSDIASYSDYDPFGMPLPYRQYDAPDYRYGFQGQEKDDEIKGEGNSLNYTFRMHDPRVGRFFAVDPLAGKYPFYSPYQFSGNRVIDMVELEGLEPAKKGSAEGEPAEAIDHNALANNTYGPSDLFNYLVFGSTENNNLFKKWYWHEGGTETTSRWYEANDYKGIVLPFAIDYAQSEGWSFGADWQSAKDLIGNPGKPSDVISQSTADFLSSRTQDAGLTDLLTQIGAHVINSANKELASKSSGVITPMDLDSPFFGLTLGLRGFALGTTENAGANMATLGESLSNNYRQTFFTAYPELEGQVVIHHAVEQQVLKRYSIFSESQIHSLENLRGIPNELNNTVHLSEIRTAWNRFYRNNANPTKEMILEQATEIDKTYGNQFLPPR